MRVRAVQAGLYGSRDAGHRERGQSRVSSCKDLTFRQGHFWGDNAMEPGVLLIVSLLSWYGVVMVMYGCAARRQKTAAPAERAVGFALREGQTIVGVMDTPQRICFCVGEIDLLSVSR